MTTVLYSLVNSSVNKTQSIHSLKQTKMLTIFGERDERCLSLMYPAKLRIHSLYNFFNDVT